MNEYQNTQNTSEGAKEERQTETTQSPEGIKPISGALQSRNVRIYNRRTSVRLEPEMWNALSEIAAMEGCSIHDLCGAVHDLKDPEASFTAALRVFMMEYYRSAYRTNGRINRVQQMIREVQTPEYQAKRRN